MTTTRSPAIVTGASGFAGSAIVQALAASGIPVAAVSRRTVESSHPLIRTIAVQSYDELSDMPELLGQARAVFHLADRADRKGYGEANRSEAAGLVSRLAAACVRHDIARFILASSIYADRPDRSHYGWSKRHAEAALLDVSSRPDMAIVLRFPPLYGQDGRGMFAMLARHIRSGHPLPLAWATGARRFLGIANLCDLARHCVTATSLRSGVYAPADPDPISLRTLALQIGAAVGRPARLIAVPFVDRLSSGTLIDPVQAAENQTAIRQGLNWQPKAGVGEQLDYLS
jgi:nucleoside-diphosphate-sugar epimerase